MSYGFAQMNGLGSGPTWLELHYGPIPNDSDTPSCTEGGLTGWRWIFIMQGILTVVITAAAYALTVDSPEMTLNQDYCMTFLTQREIQLMVSRVKKDREDVTLEEQDRGL
ncbi:uncharacterized protein A1O9_00374 [Exophiala aquamarina CBS 119918]|uniref:Major facilitator superfamily (MFS) profile domain-containing protein n=1 Tax=Exophiala aquamarina CBS 119918 TaxID=1182545 RepID=A0A072PRM9_9EURO|nr:uncharacterized protein A1O9_00374 [Exophiala aquamarina CBS 119918]KEF62402.1 hypothetical protein A1O9_00374 [Exophiala aquamarina CBS 119918]